MRRSLYAIMLAIIATSASAQVSVEQITKDRSQVQKILVENVIPYWNPNTIDKKFGGYQVNLDVNGNPSEPQDKDILSQARTMWFFARLARSPFRQKEYLDAARHGYNFISSKMWDGKHGGFYWQVDFAGSPHRSHIKQTCGQAFALYALNEFAYVARDSAAEDLARRTFAVIENHCYDREFGGYREVFQLDWSPAEPGTLSYAETDPDVKLFGTHMILMEALSEYYRRMRDSRSKERLHELIVINTQTAMREHFPASAERFERNWSPVDGSLFEVASYGHDLENLWLTQRACDMLRIPDTLLLRHYKSVADYALQYGYDENNGGFYFQGPLGRPADNRRKIWWVQVEAMVSMLKMYQMTMDPKYFDAFQKTFDWCNANLIDWERGEWYYEVAADGSVPESKSGQWKTAYHTARALLEIDDILKDFE